MESSSKKQTIKLKICGVTEAADLQMCSRGPVDYIGLNFWPQSKRYLSVEKAVEMIRHCGDSLGNETELVGLFVDQSVDHIVAVINELGCCKIIQLHGSEDQTFRKELKARLPEIGIWQACHVGQHGIPETPEHADLILLDTAVAGQKGGTGKSFDWSGLADLNYDFGLAGGIHLGNIGDAIKTGAVLIDLCSGVESQPGKKDPTKLQQLFDVWSQQKV